MDGFVRMTQATQNILHVCCDDLREFLGCQFMINKCLLENLRVWVVRATIKAPRTECAGECGYREAKLPFSNPSGELMNWQ